MNLITYVYLANKNNYEEVFEDGITFFDTDFNIEKNLIRMYDEDALYEFLSKVPSNVSVYIIRIPSDYLEAHNVNAFRKVLPYPILFERETMNPAGTVYNTYPVLVPCLIEMMYRGDYGTARNNDYNPNYNPCGLKHTKSQLERIKKTIPDWYDRMYNRNRDGDCKELYSLDTASGIWNNVKQFNNVTNEVNPFQKKGELPDVMFYSKKKKKTKTFNKKNKKRDRYIYDEEEY